MRSFVLLGLMVTCGTAAELSPATAAKVDEIAAKVLRETGAPSLSIALVQSGKIAYEKAYGKAQLTPPIEAKAEMRYSIGSVSKQILAGTVLLLVQDGKIALDDRVSKYLPDLTRAGEVTVRNLLTHTSGYQDYYPQDYIPQFMLKPVTADDILQRWAHKPLDFDPGTRWQYSNTNYVIAGRIVEKVAGVPFFEFLSKRILQPLGMTSATDLAALPRGPGAPQGYTRFAQGTPHPVATEGVGWLFAAGELAMTSHDLALWDLSLIEHKLLTPASMELLTTPARLKNGTPLSYALGVSVTEANGRPRLQHSGGVSGFVTLNTVWLEDGAAIVAFANADGSGGPRAFTNAVAPLLLAEAADPDAARSLKQAREIYDGLLQGKMDRTILTPNADAFFTRQVLQDAAVSLKLWGPLVAIRQTGVEQRGGMTYRHFDVEFKKKTLKLDTLLKPDGKLEQYLIQ